MQYYKSGDNFNDFVLGIFPLNTNCDILSDSFLTFERQIRWNLWNLWKRKSAATSALSLSPQFTQLTTKTFEQWNCAALSSKRFPVFNNLNRCLQSLTSPPHPTLKKCVTMPSVCVNYRFQADQRVWQCFQCADLDRSPISPLACFVPLEIPRNLIGKRHRFQEHRHWQVIAIILL